jgi:hypothetical protein
VIHGLGLRLLRLIFEFHEEIKREVMVTTMEARKDKRFKSNCSGLSIEFLMLLRRVGDNGLCFYDYDMHIFFQLKLGVHKISKITAAQSKHVPLFLLPRCIARNVIEWASRK